jgi:hypothetical protein
MQHVNFMTRLKLTSYDYDNNIQWMDTCCSTIALGREQTTLLLGFNRGKNSNFGKSDWLGKPRRHIKLQYAGQPNTVAIIIEDFGSGGVPEEVRVTRSLAPLWGDCGMETLDYTALPRGDNARA